MPKKAYSKKKNFKTMCRDKVKAGMINAADGTWRKATDARMDQWMIAGYKLR